MKVIKAMGVAAGLLFAIICQAQTKAIDISAVDSCMAKEAKPILILLSTDWCAYCQMQKNQLDKNKAFQAKSDLFYYVVFDAESKETIRWHGKDYAFKPTGVSTGLHELAIALNGSGNIAFPTWILLDKDYRRLFHHKGVLAPKQLEDLLQTVDRISKNNNKPPTKIEQKNN